STLRGETGTRQGRGRGRIIFCSRRAQLEWAADDGELVSPFSPPDVRPGPLSPSSSKSASEAERTKRVPPPPPPAERQRAIEKRSELSRRLLRELQATAGSLYEQRLFREAVEVYKCLTT